MRTPRTREKAVNRRRIIEMGSLGWAIVGAAVAFAALPDANDDARLLIGVASIAFPLCAVAAAPVLRRGRDRAAGLLLLASAATPTYFAYVINVPALVVGLALLAVPPVLIGSEAEERLLHTAP